MRGTLALAGGAEWTDGCSFDQELLAASGSSVVTLLLTAAAYERPSHLEARARGYFSNLGAEVRVLDVLARPDAFDPRRVAAMDEVDLLYLASGSPMHLRSVLKDSPMFDALVSRWHAGAVLAASAESATVLCSHMVDPRGGAFTLGLGLLDKLTVLPRAASWSEDKWHRTVRLAPAELAVVGIDERTALIADGGSWRASGAGEVTVWIGGHRREVGDLVSLTSV